MMNRGISAPSKPQTPLWQRLLAPMLLASLGLHGLILLVPTGASQEEVIPPPDPEQDSVAITRIPPANPASDGDEATTAGRPPVGQTPPGQSPNAPRGGIARIQRSSAGSGTGVRGGSSSLSRTTPNRAPSRTAPRQSSQSSTPSRSQTSTPAQGSASGADRPSSSSPGARSTPAAQPSAPPSSASTAPPAPSQPLDASELRAQLQAYAAELNLPQSRIDRLAAAIRERFSYDAVASANEVLPINQTQWQDLIRQATGIADLTPATLPDPLPMVYRQRACLTPAPGSVKVGILANPDGSHHSDPVVLQGSGYGAVDEKALKTVMEQEFLTAEAIKAYILTVEPDIDYGPNPCLATHPEPR